MQAGKCTASLVSGEEQIQIVPQEGAGLIYLHKTDDGLMRFCYKHRENGNVVDVRSIVLFLILATNSRIMQDLIVFPSDAIFVPVDENPEARVYLFKFKNSTMDRWLFFWMQDGDTSKVHFVWTNGKQLAVVCAEITEDLNHLSLHGELLCTARVSIWCRVTECMLHFA